MILEKRECLVVQEALQARDTGGRALSKQENHQHKTENELHRTAVNRAQPRGRGGSELSRSEVE